jgi:predicted amidohydrolase YtcJ
VRGGAAADLALLGGRVFVGLGLPEADALASAGDRVLALGRDAVLPQIGPGTKVVELRGRTVVPGFNDAHVHLMDGGLSLLGVDLRGARDEAECARRVATHARTLPEGAWIRNGHWDHESWPGAALPSRRAFDPGTEGHPLLLMRQDGHMALANTRALEIAGITGETEAPPGGAIERDARGEPTGILKDRAMELVLRKIPPPSRAEVRDAARAAFREAARLGVTTIQDNSFPEALPAYLDLRESGELTVRLSVWRYAATFEALRAAGVRSGLGDAWIRLGPLKILSDGSLGSGTAAFFDPYSDGRDGAGLLLYGEDELSRLVREADALGFQLAVHAIGDRANALVLSALEGAARENPPRERRFRIEHAQSVRREDVPRFRALPAIASIQPCHLVDDVRFARRRLGERCRDLYRAGSFLRQGIPVAFGTDWPVAPLDPRVGLFAALCRTSMDGEPRGGLNPDERLTLPEALSCYTLGSAYAEFAEGQKGTLRPGAFADLVVFGADLFALGPREILSASVDLTVVGGRVVHEA